MPQIIYSLKKSKYYPKENHFFFTSVISFFLAIFFRQPIIVLSLLTIAVIPIFWGIVNIDNDGYYFLIWLKRAILNFLTFPPITIVFIAFLIFFLMDLRLISADQKTDGQYKGRQSQVFIYKSSKKVSSRSDWVKYKYHVDGNSVRATQHFYNRSNMPEKSPVGVYYDIAFPFNNSRLAGTHFHHTLWFLPYFFWLSIVGVIWPLCMEKWFP